MNISIKATNIDLTYNIKSYIQKKMDMLEKYLGKIDIIKAQFEIEMTTRHHNKGKIFRAEANMSLPGELLRVEKTEKDVFKAIDKVKDHMRLVIKKYKEKKIAKTRQTAK